MDLALDVVTFINLLIYNLSSKLHINLLHLDNTECYDVVHDGDDEDTVVGSLRKKQKVEHKLARDLLKEVTGKACHRLRTEIIKETNIDKSKLPSLYHLTKDRPTFNYETYFGDTATGSPTATTAATSSTTNVAPVGSSDTMKQIDDIFLTVPNSIKNKNNNDDVKMVAKILAKEQGYLVCKIKKGYEHYLNIMIDKYLMIDWKVQGNMMVIDSFDGAVHSSTNTRDSGIVSYSTLLLFHSDYYMYDVSSATSTCILTSMNSLTGETRETLFPLLIPIYKEQQQLRLKAASIRDGCSFKFHQMHDAKFAYTLTAHAGWGSTNSPYLLCGCNKGEGVGNDKHVCTLISDTEQLVLYEQAEQQWLTIDSKSADTKIQKKEKEQYKKWISNNNNGVSHFGLHLSLLPLSAIRCDVFHMGCSVGKRMISYLQSFAGRQGHKFESKLFKILKTVWSAGVLCLWRVKKKFSQLLGIEIKAFVLQCPVIATLLRSPESGLRQTPEVVSLAKALDLWYVIEKHLKRAKVNKKEAVGFSLEIEKFKKNIDSFYECGIDTFLTSVEMGDDETYYLHALKYYILYHARKTWDNHKCGIGVFTMQGFERRNKESKNILRQFSNMKNQMPS